MKSPDFEVEEPQFKPVGSQSEEAFGKMKREAEPTVKDLLVWEEMQDRPQPIRGLNKNLEWISEAQDSFKAFVPHGNPRPASSFKPKAIEDNEDRPPKSLSPQAAKSGKQAKNPQQGKNRELSPQAPGKKQVNQGLSKTPKSGKVKNTGEHEKNDENGKSGHNPSQRQLERLKKLNQTTRWLPNSAFKTYFGKPIFANYGMGNVNPAYGGLMYGDYMKTHNIAPHEGSNNPQTQQVYEIAETKALGRASKPQIVPRKCKDEDRLPPEEVDKIKQRSLILPKNKLKPSKEIVKPNLLEEKIFKSEHGTPHDSEDEAEKPQTKSQLSLNKPSSKAPQGSQGSQVPVVAQVPQALQILSKPGDKKPARKSQDLEPTASNPEKSRNPSNVNNPKNLLGRVPDDRNIEEAKEQDEQSEVHRNDYHEEDKSHDASAQAEDCADCNRQNFNKLIRTSYQDMTGKITVDRNNQIVEPYKYCARCRDCLYSEDVLKPPYSLGEIPPQELNPKNYKTLPPQWTQRIPAAGKLSYRSPSAYNVIFGENQPLGGAYS